ncbi:hypothetical protein GCM10020254_44260 [Streptomyces goshikiensis]
MTSACTDSRIAYPAVVEVAKIDPPGSLDKSGGSASRSQGVSFSDTDREGEGAQQRAYFTP